jgi:diguanylate cyclase (GGDEF)-like protein
LVAVGMPPRILRQLRIRPVALMRDPARTLNKRCIAVETTSHEAATSWRDSRNRHAPGHAHDDGSRAERSLLVRRNEELEATNQQLMLEVERLAALASLDPLTGLGNRRHFDECVDSELRRAAREREPLTLLICDVDRFKECNDAHGHTTGDELLVGIGHLLKRYCRRGGDLVFRYAGDEFALLWPGVSRDAARGLANQLGAAARDLTIHCPDGATCVRVTLSIGGVTFEDHHEVCARQQFVDAADRALYRAKRAGRDRASFADGTCRASPALSAPTA